MNNTIDFKTAKTIDSMSKKLDHIDDAVTGFFSIMHMANIWHRLNCENPKRSLVIINSSQMFW